MVGEGSEVDPWREHGQEVRVNVPFFRGFR